MRATTAGEQAVLQARHSAHFCRVEIQDEYGEWVDYSDYLALDLLDSVELTQSNDERIMQATVEVARNVADGSLSPLINSDIDLGRGLRVYGARVLPGVTPAANDWKLLFDGRIDRWEAASDPIRLTGRDRAGVLVDRRVEAAASYGSELGTPIEDVMQDILDQWADYTFTLYVPAGSGILTTPFVIFPYEVEPQSVWEALTTLADMIGYVLEYRWDPDTDAFRLTLMEPDRTVTVPEWTFGPDDYYKVTKLDADLLQVRNAWSGRYLDSVSGLREQIVVVNQDSIDRFKARRWAEIVEADDSPIDTAAEMTAMLDAAVADTSWPDADHEIEVDLFWPVQLMDFYRHSPNAVHYDADQDYAVAGFTHTFRDGTATTRILTRGKPAGSPGSWRRRVIAERAPLPNVIEALWVEWVKPPPGSQVPGVYGFVWWHWVLTNAAGTGSIEYYVTENGLESGPYYRNSPAKEGQWILKADPNADDEFVVVATPCTGQDGTGERGPTVTYPIETTQNLSVRSEDGGGPIVGMQFDPGLFGIAGDADEALSAMQYAAAVSEAKGGGTMRLGHGEYTIAGGDILLPKTVFLAGEGSESTTLKAEKAALTSGTATAGGASALTDSGKSWTTNAYAGKWVEITAGTGSGQIRKILSNTATALTNTMPWKTNPSSDSEYKVYTPTRLLCSGSGNWRHQIENVRLDGVQVVYGDTTSDYGNGALLEGCEILNCAIGIETKNSAWIHAVSHTSIYFCGIGVLYNFAAATLGAGAALRISASQIFNCYRGVAIEGVTADGFDIVIDGGADIEHNYIGVWINAGSSGSEGTLHLTDCHFELNDAANIYAESSGNGITIFEKGGWAFVPAPCVHARVGQYVRLFLSHMRLQWTPEYLFTMAGGDVIIDTDSIFTNNAFFGQGSAKMASAGSSAGSIWNGGPAYSGRAGKVYAGQVARTLQLSAGGASDVITYVQAYDKSARVLEFDLEVTVAASASQILRVYLNPGGGGASVDVVMPTQLGGGRFRVTYNPTTKIIEAGGIFADIWSGTGKAWYYTAKATASHADSAQKTIEFASLSTSGTRATMVIRNLFEYVH